MTVPHTDPRWRKSTFTQDQGACVMLHPEGAVLDSKDPEGPQLGLSWDELVAAVKSHRLTR